MPGRIPVRSIVCAQALFAAVGRADAVTHWNSAAGGPHRSAETVTVTSDFLLDRPGSTQRGK